MNEFAKLLLSAVLGLSCVACVETGDESIQAIGAGDNWPLPGGDESDSHYSRLTDINKENVNSLGLAWSYELGSNRVQEATPVVIDGIMYTSGNLGRVFALNATTGEELWLFEPEVDMQVNRVVCCDQANRGVALADGKIIVGALDGILYALDQKTGEIVWRVDTIVDRERGYSSTGAPEVAGDLVLIGNAGSEFDVRGYVSAYHISDGSLAWRFYTIPHDPGEGPQETEDLEHALETWGENSRWDIGGGGTVWDAIVYDSRFDTVYIGTGNGGPYSHAARSEGEGDNLYLSSIVALDRQTGKLKWHYQETPRDSWDFTATQPMVLTDMEIGGEARPVIIHSPKNGYLYVIDRETGKLHAANALVRTSWADGYDLETGRPKLTPEFSDYSTGPKIVFPSSAGARNWYPPAFDPETGIYYASVLDMGNLMYMLPGEQPHRERGLNAGASLIFTTSLEAFLPNMPPHLREQIEKLPQMEWVRDNPGYSQMRAIDPMTGKTIWAIDREGWQDRAGALVTKSGLLFHGSIDGKFFVRDAASGEVLKEIETGSAIMAGASTYKVDGVQYVAVAAGWGGGGWSFVPDYSAPYRYENTNRILVFKLDGGPVEKPALLPPLEVAPEPPAQAANVTPEVIGKGAQLFFANCALCHSNMARSISPDLRRLTPEKHEMFRDILLEGLLVGLGMPRWDDLLSEEDVGAIHAYLIDLQGKQHAREKALKEAGKPLDSKGLVIMSNY
ncbi:PQQ-dependent dehydrogenase, methanol/ethanol family [Emcibacter sp.]|uniref:PQQ-dependent dehydrogenase, methanol/ethanol family n=1 Tax=Emcibacter sp. TaxID=1979954 RepID=UPI002AA95527|nr:PQQ-dependent dehydrogenase, methanol/ethanol family [Emcibacter sp.]